jgi:hypothetical protein
LVGLKYFMELNHNRGFRFSFIRLHLHRVFIILIGLNRFA